MNNSRGKVVAGVLALLFVPGTIPAFIAYKTAKFRKKKLAQQNLEG